MTKHFSELLVELSSYGSQSEILNEELHPELQHIINRESDTPGTKLNEISKKIRSLKVTGQDTGLEDDKPKKGSSRAVFFPRDHHPVTLDGIQTKLPTAVKIGYPSTIENYKTGVNPHTDDLLGHMQNRVENDWALQKRHGVMTQNDDGTWTHNPEGIVPPIIDAHPEGHWLHVGKVSKMNAKDFKESTKTPEFPKGITHTEFHDTIQNMWTQAHGGEGYHYAKTSQDRMRDLEQHPFVNSAKEMVLDHDIHPADFVTGNMGIWEHPVTGKKQPVIIDYGFSKDIAKRYSDLRTKLWHWNRKY